MAKSATVVLDDRLEQFIETQIEAGAYASEGDVLRAGLELMLEDEARKTALVAALREGLESGFIDDFDFEEHLAELKTRTA
jgi:antitoxin ParD1/3/4